jgi:hypothetical protein
MPKFQPVTVPVQVIRNPAIRNPASTTIDKRCLRLRPAASPRAQARAAEIAAAPRQSPAPPVQRHAD